ncbi:MAG: FAD-binding oxidoreductase, partial [candidate division WOR-3 bacterium]|nr:FAD-binding oxidoreductase [candidate division WOR-3 bacterium]
MANTKENLNANNIYLPEPMRIVRRYDLIEDVRFFQVRPLETERALQFNYLPGQFVMISLAGVGEAPFSISSTPSRPGLLEFGIRKVGIVTEELFKLKENEIIGVRGPYGNGFPIDKFENKDLIIVVGGLGAVPLRSLLLYTLDNRDRFGKIYFLYGARRPQEMLFRREF